MLPIAWEEGRVILHRGVAVSAVVLENRRRCWTYRLPSDWQLTQEYCSAEEAMDNAKWEKAHAKALGEVLPGSHSTRRRLREIRSLWRNSSCHCTAT